jgi:nicotinamidase-related amidase
MKPVAAAPYSWPFDGAWSAADTALLVVDAQHWLLDALPGLEARIARLVTAARTESLLVLFTARTRPEAVALRRAVTPDALLPEGQGAALAFDVPPHDVIARAAYSAFAGTALDQVLRNVGARNLILCGAVTEGAVHATMRDANDRGYECLLVEDACASPDAAHHAAILRITRFGNGLFGCTAPTQAVLEAMA